jgi:hypothetical protein
MDQIDCDCVEKSIEGTIGDEQEEVGYGSLAYTRDWRSSTLCAVCSMSECCDYMV